MTTEPAPPQTSDPGLAELAATVSGVVLAPGAPGYTEECTPFNLAVTHRPAVVVGAATAADVQAAVRHARDRGLPVAVMATGHEASLSADGAVLVTTRRMSGVRIDPSTRTATVGAGVTWQQVVDAAAPHGLAPLNGSSATVGVVGYTLGGGLSPTMGRAFGWAADAVQEMDVVTAHGALRRVTADGPDADLFWGLPGAKGALGIVTSMSFRLFPVSRLHAGGLFFAGADAAAVLHAYADLTATAPDELTTSVAFLRMPPLPTVPELLRGRFVVQVRVSHLGTAAAAGEVLRPLREAAPLLVDTVGELPYREFASIHADPTGPVTVSNRSALLGPLTHEAVDTLLEWAGDGAACPVPVLELRHLGGALARGSEAANATAGRHAEFVLHALVPGTEEQAAPALAWTEALVEALAPVVVPGRNVNFVGAGDVDRQAVAAAHDPSTLARLRQVKRAVDPANTFRLSHDVVPQGSTAR
jgi:FAD/FMN-containing dehydrogenase